MRLAGLFVVVFFAGCRCTPPVSMVEPADVSASPTELRFDPTWLGQRATGQVEVVNRGGATADLAVSLDGPFTVDEARLTLVRGEQRTLTVTFAPTQAGLVSATLHVGELAVALVGEGRDVPACLPRGVCFEAQFDLQAGICRDALLPAGTACETRCVTGGCAGESCVGTLRGCDDGDACTLDGCSEADGCSHVVRDCPAPPSPCQVAACDPARGCSVEDAPDGTLCGPDDCTATEVDVCVLGRCVRRTRPATGRCHRRAHGRLPLVGPARGVHHRRARGARAHRRGLRAVGRAALPTLARAAGAVAGHHPR